MKRIIQRPFSESTASNAFVAKEERPRGTKNSLLYFPKKNNKINPKKLGRGIKIKPQSNKIA